MSSVDRHLDIQFLAVMKKAGTKIYLGFLWTYVFIFLDKQPGVEY